MSRTVIFGDVHGCFDELQALLKTARLVKGDRLVSVGDLIGKGPASDQVAAWAMETPELECVLGNHELRYVDAWRRGLQPASKSYDAETLRQLGGRYDPFCRWASKLPLTIDEGAWMVVHAGIDPRWPLSLQIPEDLTTLRRLEDRSAWYESYEDPRLIVFGHWVRRDPVVRSNAIGLDTGCVYGGSLSALILPERRLISVPARRAYTPRQSWN